nr:cell wall protein DAN4-like [Procambarus clarkii]
MNTDVFRNFTAVEFNNRPSISWQLECPPLKLAQKRSVILVGSQLHHRPMGSQYLHPKNSSHIQTQHMTQHQFHSRVVHLAGKLQANRLRPQHGSNGPLITQHPRGTRPQPTTTSTTSHTNNTAGRSDQTRLLTTSTTSHTKNTAGRSDQTRLLTTSTTSHTKNTAGRSDQTRLLTTSTTSHTKNTAGRSDQTRLLTTSTTSHTNNTAGRSDQTRLLTVAVTT